MELLGNNFAFYGTLRRGGENFPVFQEHLVYKGTVWLPGFKLFSLGAYPYAILTGDAWDKIKVDLFKIDDFKTIESIHKMEIEVGYQLYTVEFSKENFGIYLFDKMEEKKPAILSGDWMEYIGSFDF